MFTIPSHGWFITVLPASIIKLSHKKWVMASQSSLFPKKNGSLGVYTPFSDKPKWRFAVPTLQVWRYPILKPLCQDFPGAWAANPINPKKDKSDWTSLTKLVYSKMGGTHEYMLNPFPKAIRLSIAFTRVCHGFWMIWWLLAPGLVDLPPCKQMGLGLVQWPTPPTTPTVKNDPLYPHMNSILMLIIWFHIWSIYNIHIYIYTVYIYIHTQYIHTSGSFHQLEHMNCCREFSSGFHRGMEDLLPNTTLAWCVCLRWKNGSEVVHFTLSGGESPWK